MWPGYIRGWFESHIVALDVRNLGVAVQAAVPAPVHWTPLILVTDKTIGASVVVLQTIITGVSHFFSNRLC